MKTTEINLFNPAAENKTMSSREIAEITGKEHRSVLRDIDNLNDNYEKMGLLKIEQGTYVHPVNKQEYREYRLTRMQTFDLMTGYNAELRIRVNRRWEELETKTAETPEQIMARALLVAQQTIEAHKQQTQILESQKQILETTVQNLAPKAQYTDEVLQSTSTFTTTQIAKGLGMSAINLNQRLKKAGIQFYQSSQWFLTSRYQGKGYTQMRVTKYIDQETEEVKSAQTMVWTERGRLFINQLLKGGKI